jgi:hypothetical protein
MNAQKLDFDAVLDVLADLLADKLTERIASRQAAASPYYDTEHNPLGKRRFLEAARRGDFPSFKRGRRVLALRTDVDAWIAKGARSKPANNNETLSDEQLLATAGVRLLRPARVR